MATHSRSLAWEIPWTEETGWLLSMESQKSQTTQQLNNNQCLSTRLPTANHELLLGLLQGLGSTNQASNLLQCLFLYNLGAKYAFLTSSIGYKKLIKGILLRDMKIRLNSNFSTRKYAPLEHGHSYLFVYLLSTACSTMTELSSGDIDLYFCLCANTILS